ncbi:MAG: SDR family oxidoreductase [Anaerolineales bacterium]|nr:SDR family oxidoreductase [Anaerolineales bacterium]
MSGVSATGRVALVTGAARGLGAAAAVALAEVGASVVLCDIDQAEVEDQAARIRANGGSALALAHDITSLAEIKRLVAGTLAHYGRLDILVNNAGICPRISIEGMTEESYDRIMNTNLRSVFFLSREAGNAMKPTGWGRIINVSSTGGRTGGIFNATVYSASKAGIMSMTKAFARHFAPDNIIVNCIAPGTVNTRLMSNLPQASLDAAVSQVPLKRLAEPSEIAKVIVFLASDLASYMTGAILDVNGGAVMP